MFYWDTQTPSNESILIITHEKDI